ncbi:MAG: tetratricopeptide repeat protein [Leptonema sp. (in: bacteria)]
MLESTEHDLIIPETKQATNQEKKLFYIVIIGMAILFLFLLGAGIFYYFQKNKWTDSKEKGVLNPETNTNESLKEKYYYPSEKEITPQLRKALQYYKEGFLTKAEKHFQSIIDNSQDDLEKAVAYTFLGIIALDLEKYPLAKHYFSKALAYKEKYLPALVNLSITEYHLGNLEDAFKQAMEAKKIAPEDPLVSLLVGNILMNLKGAQEAELEFRKTTQLEPQEPIARYNLGISLLRQGKTQEALVEFQNFLDLFPYHNLTPIVLSQMAQIYYSLGQYEKSLNFYKKASGLSPDNAKIYYNIGVVYYNLNDPTQAKEYFRKALNLGKTDPEVFEKLSYVFEELGEPELTKKTIERSLQYNPDHLPSLFRLAEIYKNSKNYLEAAEIYRKIVNRTPGTETTESALLELGKIYIEMERYPDAVFVLKKALDLQANPKIEVYYELGRAYEYGNRKDKAIEIWKHALEKDPLTPEEKTRILIQLAKTYQNIGSYDLALKELKKVDITEKNSNQVYLQMGVLYKNIKDYETAIGYFNKVFESANSSILEKKEAAIQIAECYLSTKEIHNLEPAKAWIHKAIRLDPKDPKITITLAKILILSSTTNDLEKAIEILLPITYSDQPPSILKEAYFTLGVAYYKNQEYQRALNAFQMVLQWDPANEEAIGYKNKIIKKREE